MNYAIAGGDSGAAVWSGNIMFGVVSGKSGATKNFDTAIAPHVHWIQETMNTSRNSSAYEILQAFRGGIASSYIRSEDIEDLISSSS